MSELTATLYKVVSCCYRDENTNKSFGEFEPVVDNLLDWLSGLATVGESCTYEPKQDDSFLRTFCLDARRLKSLNAVLIVTWNEVSSAEEGVQLIAANAAIGEAQVSAAQIDAMSVPGYPAFFVLIPKSGQIINLRFAQRLNGSQAFKRYLLGFMQEGAKWCVWDSSGEKFLGYAADGRHPKGSYMPELETRLLRRSSNLDWLRQEVGNVRKIVHRKLIRPVVEEHRSFLDATFVMLGLKPNHRLKADIEFEYDFKIRLDAEKLERIIENFDNKDDYDGWTDVGFILARDSTKKHWLSGELCREKIAVDVRHSAPDMVDIDHLVEILNAHLEGYLRRIQ